MTPQEAFNAVWHGIIAQGKPSGIRRDANTFTCLYRGPEDSKCAVGLLLTDEEAAGLDPSDETDNGTNVYGIYSRKRLPKRLVPLITLLSHMQNAHDTSAPRDDFLDRFKEKMRDIAELHGLTVPE